MALTARYRVYAPRFEDAPAFRPSQRPRTCRRSGRCRQTPGDVATCRLPTAISRALLLHGMPNSMSLPSGAGAVYLRDLKHPISVICVIYRVAWSCPGDSVRLLGGPPPPPRRCGAIRRRVSVGLIHERCHRSCHSSFLRTAAILCWSTASTFPRLSFAAAARILVPSVARQSPGLVGVSAFHSTRVANLLFLLSFILCSVVLLFRIPFRTAYRSLTNAFHVCLIPSHHSGVVLFSLYSSSLLYFAPLYSLCASLMPRDLSMPAPLFGRALKDPGRSTSCATRCERLVPSCHRHSPRRFAATGEGRRFAIDDANVPVFMPFSRHDQPRLAGRPRGTRAVILAIHLECCRNSTFRVLAVAIAFKNQSAPLDVFRLLRGQPPDPTSSKWWRIALRPRDSFSSASAIIGRISVLMRTNPFFSCRPF